MSKQYFLSLHSSPHILSPHGTDRLERADVALIGALARQGRRLELATALHLYEEADNFLA